MANFEWGVLPADVMVQYYSIISPSKKAFLVCPVLAIQVKPVYQTAPKGVALHLSLFMCHMTHTWELLQVSLMLKDELFAFILGDRIDYLVLD